MLALGNRQSATNNPSLVAKLLAKDVKHGFVIPIPTASIVSIPDAMVQPLGIAKQFTLDAEGRRQPKNRLTQDLTFQIADPKPPTSVNNRVHMDAYPEMIYGWCLSRILHFVMALCAAFPQIAILMCKYDYSDAYRRMAHSATAARHTISVTDEIAYLCLY